jgi:hypothetical protein
MHPEKQNRERPEQGHACDRSDIFAVVVVSPADGVQVARKDICVV